MLLPDFEFHHLTSSLIEQEVKARRGKTTKQKIRQDNYKTRHVKKYDHKTITDTDTDNCKTRLSQDKTSQSRPDKTRPDKIRQDKARQGRQGKTRQSIQDKTRHRRDKTRQDNHKTRKLHEDSFEPNKGDKHPPERKTVGKISSLSSAKMSFEDSRIFFPIFLHLSRVAQSSKTPPVFKVISFKKESAEVMKMGK